MQTPNQNDNWVIVGRFGRPHGIKGFVSVYSFTDPIDKIFSYEPWYYFNNNDWEKLDLLEVDLQSKYSLVKVKSFESRELAFLLTQREIAIPVECLPPLPPGEYYWRELVGMTVVNLEGVLLGKIIEMLSTGSNDVCVVEGDKRYLIPYLPKKFILSVNVQKKEMRVDWDEDF